MKNRIVSLALCVVSLAASIILLTSIINRDEVIIKTPDKDVKNPEIVQPQNPNPGDKLELSEVGLSAFASRIESFVTRLAYENDKSYETELAYILENSAKASEWLRENARDSEAEYYDLIAGMFEVVSTVQTNDEFSSFVSDSLRNIDEKATDSEMCPDFDTEIGGSLTLALIAVNDALTQKGLDASTTFTVTVGGGAMLGDKIGVSQDKSFKQAYDSSTYSFPFYKLSAFLANDDMSFATLLAPLTESAEPDEDILEPVKGLPYYAQSLFGIDCLSIAPIRMLDYGQTGYDDTVKALSENGISYYNGTEYSDTPYGKIAYISVDLTGSEVTIAARDKNEEFIKAQVESERENGADLVILQLCWNTRLRQDVEPHQEKNADYVGNIISEYEQHMDAFNKEIAREAIRAGADLVVGTGSHVLQGIELFNGKYIVYSPGNLTYSGNLDEEQPNVHYAYLFQVTFEKSEGENRVLSTRVIPIENNSSEAPFLTTPVFGSKADTIIDMLVFQSAYFTNPINSFDYIKITK